MEISCPKCKKAMFDSSLRQCPGCGTEFTDKQIKSRTRITTLVYFMMALLAVLLLLLFFLPKEAETIKADIVETKGNQTIFKYSEKYTKIEPEYSKIEINDTSISGAKRMTLKISFLAGPLPTEEYLQEQLIQAAFSQMFKNNVSAITVWAYSDGDDYDMGYTLAMCMVAPYGDLRRAVERVGKKDLRATFQLAPLYGAKY